MKKFIPTQEELDNILKMYNENLLGSHTISEKMGISKPTVLRILKENGITMKSSGRRNIGGREVATKKYFSKPEVKERLKKNHKKWSEKNKEHLTEYHKKWRTENVEKWRSTKRNYERNRKASDPAYKLISNFRTAIYQVLKENNVEKNKHYFDILQYTPEELISHLEKQFTDGMTWENYGEWHVDHRMPISSFNFESVDDDSFIKCWSLDNLQPMWGKENIVKSNNIIY
jgi:predicted transcriptional regulator